MGNVIPKAGDTFTEGIVKALGLEGKISSIDIHIKWGDVVTVTTKRYMEKEAGEELVKMLKKYKLIEDDDE